MGAENVRLLSTCRVDRALQLEQVLLDHGRLARCNVKGMRETYVDSLLLPGTVDGSVVRWLIAVSRPNLQKCDERSTTCNEGDKRAKGTPVRRYNRLAEQHLGIRHTQIDRPARTTLEVRSADEASECIRRKCIGRDGGIGRRSGLKIRRPQGLEGSNPSPGTNFLILEPV